MGTGFPHVCSAKRTHPRWLLRTPVVRVRGPFWERHGLKNWELGRQVALRSPDPSHLELALLVMVSPKVQWWRWCRFPSVLSGMLSLTSASFDPVSGRVLGNVSFEAVFRVLHHFGSGCTRRQSICNGKEGEV